MSSLRELLRHPGRLYRVLVPVAVLCWFVSGVGGTDVTPSDGFEYYVAAVGWALFLITLLIIVAFSLVVVGSRLRRSAAPR